MCILLPRGTIDGCPDVFDSQRLSSQITRAVHSGWKRRPSVEVYKRGTIVHLKRQSDMTGQDTMSIVAASENETLYPQHQLYNSKYHVHRPAPDISELGPKL